MSCGSSGPSVSCWPAWMYSPTSTRTRAVAGTGVLALLPLLVEDRDAVLAVDGDAAGQTGDDLRPTGSVRLALPLRPARARQDGAGIDLLAFADQQLDALRQVVAVAVQLAGDDADAAGLAIAGDLNDAVDLGDDRLVLGHAGLEQLRDARQTGRDLTTGHVDTTGVEGTHGQLRAGLTDRLGGDDADRLSHGRRARRVPG